MDKFQQVARINNLSIIYSLGNQSKCLRNKWRTGDRIIASKTDGKIQEYWGISKVRVDCNWCLIFDYISSIYNKRPN